MKYKKPRNDTKEPRIKKDKIKKDKNKIQSSLGFKKLTIISKVSCTIITVIIISIITVVFLVIS